MGLIADKLFGRPDAPGQGKGAEVSRPPGHLQVGCASDVGRVRTHNEDALLVLTIGQLGHLAKGDAFGLFILADGMGGHKAGEVASLLATRATAQGLVTDVLAPYLGREGPTAMKTIADALSDAVKAADRLVKEHVVGGGTTLTCALVLGERVHIAHVGDSRAYILTDGNLRQVTQDHSLVDRLVEMGQISPDEALSHPQRNILYRAVGQGDGLDVDTHSELLPVDARLLLCSDGLWGMVSDAHIASILSSVETPQAACDSLIEAANQAGGKDNISAVVIVRR